MKIRTALISTAACVLLASACGKDKDSKKKEADQSSAERWNPEDIEGSFVGVGPWTLQIPTADKLKSYIWTDDESLTKLIASDEVPFSAIVDSKGTKANFAAKFVKDHCENYKAAPATGETGGKTPNGINWFLKNQGANFDTFSATTTAEKFSSCITMTIRSDESLPALADGGDVVRYFKSIADEISFDRFTFVHFNSQRIQSYFVTALSDGLDLTETNGITAGTAKDIFFTIDGKKNELVGEAITGECENQVFKDGFSDRDKQELSVYLNTPIDAKYSSKIVSSDGEHNRVVEGVFKNSTDSTCLILKFSLASPVDSISVVQDDKELEEELVYQLKITSLVPKT
ncbi:MAG: hypothetical protein M3Q07_26585 [Pseudobdellovibrionaceae bacterium]|nr:hypothetical protein [Pseudobdellovibrionaceae bacterium]